MLFNQLTNGQKTIVKWFSFKKSNLYFLCIVFLLMNCSKPAERISEQEVALAWAELAIYITKDTPSNTPTFASRGFGYIGLTMYESVVHGYDNYKSLAGQLNGLENLPLPFKNLEYNWQISLNAAEARILKVIYIQTSERNKLRIDSLEQVFYDYYSEDTDKEIIERSTAFGRAIADSIFVWSKTDGGHRGYLRNFDKEFKIDYAPGLWEPPLYGQTFSHKPLHPYWGQNRNFSPQNSTMPVPDMISYDTVKGSVYYNQFRLVYEKSKTLTQKEKEAALWWNDDPNETFTPPGHSYQLAVNTVRQAQPSLIKCAETFARIGLAVADAFINCWRWKYHYKSERPSSFIVRHIEEEWEPFWPDPPFPAFPSGHATQAAAAVTVLTDLYGEKFSITDNAHKFRPKDNLRDVEYTSRTFYAFWDVARETADSRFYGGIHSPQDNEVGLTQGKIIGQHINQLLWHDIESK